MGEVSQHYDELLAQHYTWMAGMAFEDKVAEQLALLRNLGIGPRVTGAAFDLGSGPGFQSLALAMLGFERVVAVDTSRALLDELLEKAGNFAIEAIHDNLCALPRIAGPGSVDTIVCMGDTLTHLTDRGEVSQLFANAHAALAPGGTLVLTFRDLTIALSGVDRFLPIRADADRIMTCVLDYEPASVIVTDLIHTRSGETWTLRKSSYRKLRLAPAEMVGELSQLGFEVRQSDPVGRLCVLSATKT